MIRFEDLNNRTLLGKGGTGKAYLIPAGEITNFPVVVKIYKNSVMEGKEQAIAAHLRRLRDIYRSVSPNDQRFLNNYTLWPQKLVSKNEIVAGYIMYLIPDSFRVRYTSGSGNELVIDSTFDFIMYPNDKRREFGIVPIQAVGRAKIAYDFLRIISKLHSLDVVYGDFSQNNELISVNERNQKENRVLFMDMDSVRIIGTVNPFEQPHTEPWVPPECRSNGGVNFIQNKRTDVYKLCLAILRLYNCEECSKNATITESQYALDRISRHIGNDFSKMIHRGLSDDPSIRPEAVDLKACMERCLRSQLN